jgi:HEAT repeat protein
LNAATLLARLEPAQMPRIVLALAAALRDRNPRGRRIIVLALGNLGPKAREAVPALLPLLHDEVPAVRKEAIKALQVIDPPAAKRLGLAFRAPFDVN